jgi:hypothetical protein
MYGVYSARPGVGRADRNVSDIRVMGIRRHPRLPLGRAGDAVGVPARFRFSHGARDGVYSVCPRVDTRVVVVGQLKTPALVT